MKKLLVSALLSVTVLVSARTNVQAREIYFKVDFNKYDYSFMDNNISEEEIIMMAQCVISEAGNQSDLGKRYVIDTILNRKESSKYPDTVTEVLTQQSQYYINSKVEPDGETIKLVRNEIKNQKDTEVLYFRTNQYHSFGEPVIKIDDHYFSK